MRQQLTPDVPRPPDQKLIDDDGLEVLPCDARPRLNAWLKAQRCVEGCSFRFEGKRPSVIRAHVVHCKNRAIGMTVDPLKRLCQLQLEAHTFDTRMCVPSLFRARGRPCH